MRALIALLGLALLTGNAASAFSIVSVEKPASGSLGAPTERLGGSTLASSERVRENLRWLYDGASDSPVAARGTTTLFRAVSEAEHADVLATGALRAGPNSFETGKWFAESAEHAVKWGNALEGPGKFRVLQLEFPSSAADQFFRLERLDGIGPARFGTFDQIGSPTISVLPGIP